MKKIFVLCLVLFSFSYAGIKENDISSVMQTKIDTAILYLQNKDLSKEQKANKVFELFDGIFDYELMAKISLSAEWKKLSKEQQNFFSKAFEQRLKESFVDKINMYSNQKMLIKNLEKPKKNRIFLTSELKGDEQNLNVVYKFYDTGKDWKIYDVDILDVSIVQTYRNQLSGILEKQGFNELIKRLKTSVISTEK